MVWVIHVYEYFVPMQRFLKRAKQALLRLTVSEKVPKVPSKKLGSLHHYKDKMPLHRRM